MTETTKLQEPNASSTKPQITFRDGVTQSERENAEHSVAALVARAAAAAARYRTAEDDLAKAIATLTRPIVKPLEEDPVAKAAAEQLRSLQLLQPEAIDAIYQNTPLTSAYHDMTPAPRDPGLWSLGFVPPYDFQWAWHDTNGHAPFNMIQDRASGSLGLDARSGSLPGGASGFVNAHAGFGVFLRSDTTTQKYPHAVLNPGRFGFTLRAVGVGSNATSEGHFEITVFEDGRFLTGASRRLWRSRVSGSVTHPDESASGNQGNQVITGPEVQFTIRAGHEYTFNAGIWVFSDRSTGVGAGAVQSLLQGTLTRMWVFG